MKVKEKTQALLMQLAALLLMAVFSLILYSRAEAAQPQVAAGVRHTVGLKSDGTVVAVGWNFYGQLNVDAWTDITQVAAGANHTVGLKSDGMVVATGWNEYGQVNVAAWTGITITGVAAGAGHTVGLKSDGTVVAVGWNVVRQCDVGAWTGITGVAAGGAHTVGLKSDGTVVAVGAGDYRQLNVGAWTGITGVAAGIFHTVGLKSDGTVVAVGWNEYGQCDTSDWYLNEKGTIGTQVTLTGSGFGTKKGKVSVGGKTCKVSEWAAQSITCEIKAALPPMAYDVVVKPKEPKGVDPIIYEKAFTMMAPEITSVVPGSGAEGTEVTISGSFFSTKKGKVYLGYKKGKVLSWAMHTITFVVPKKLTSGTYDVTVVNKVGSDTLIDGFTITIP